MLKDEDRNFWRVTTENVESKVHKKMFKHNINRGDTT